MILLYLWILFFRAVFWCFAAMIWLCLAVSAWSLVLVTAMVLILFDREATIRLLSGAGRVFAPPEYLRHRKSHA